VRRSSKSLPHSRRFPVDRSVPPRTHRRGQPARAPPRPEVPTVRVEHQIGFGQSPGPRRAPSDVPWLYSASLSSSPSLSSRTAWGRFVGAPAHVVLQQFSHIFSAHLLCLSAFAEAPPWRVRVEI
jgi:hypothetical protein